MEQIIILALTRGNVAEFIFVKREYYDKVLSLRYNEKSGRNLLGKFELADSITIGDASEAGNLKSF